MQQMQKVVDVTCGKSGKADKGRKSIIPPIHLPPCIAKLSLPTEGTNQPTNHTVCQMPKILTLQSKITPSINLPALPNYQFQKS